MKKYDYNFKKMKDFDLSLVINRLLYESNRRIEDSQDENYRDINDPIVHLHLEDLYSDTKNSINTVEERLLKEKKKNLKLIKEIKTLKAKYNI